MAPANDDALSWPAKGIKGQGKISGFDCDAESSDQQVSADNKRFSTLRARLAIAGYALSRTNEADGVVIYHASRWGMVRALDNLAAVELFVGQVGARA